MEEAETHMKDAAVKFELAMAPDAAEEASNVPDMYLEPLRYSKQLFVPLFFPQLPLFTPMIFCFQTVVQRSRLFQAGQAVTAPSSRGTIVFPVVNNSSIFRLDSFNMMNVQLLTRGDLC